jgi:ribonuclease inhibitor
MARHFYIDTTKCSTIDDVHDQLKAVLHLPDYYGKNLNALWDCLTGWLEMPLTIEWIGFEDAEKRIGSTVRGILELLQEAENEIPGFRIIISTENEKQH